MSHDIPRSSHERSREHHIDLSTDEWTERLANAPLYKKTAVVHIRPATPGELVVTVLTDGSRETENTAGEGDVVVTNPSGEKQIVSLEKAVQRYDLTDTPGLFLAKGMVRAINNPSDAPITIRAPWGGLQHGDSNCKIAALFDPSDPDTVSTDRYLIGGNEFLETYGEDPVDLTAREAVTPSPSAMVLQAMEEYDSRAEVWQFGARSHLGGMGLYFSNLFPGLAEYK